MLINQQLEIRTCIFIQGHGNIDRVHDGELQSSHNKSLLQIFRFMVFTILQKNTMHSLVTSLNIGVE